jgi:hypothetical protein
LAQSLHNTPEVRPQAVERAQTLMTQAAYPPTEVIQRIANVLARHLTSSTN